MDIRPHAHLTINTPTISNNHSKDELNSASVPLGDVTSATNNTPLTTGSKRKATNTPNTPNTAQKTKKAQILTATNASTPVVSTPITTSAIVGVGPTLAPVAALVPINPTVAAIERVLTKTKPRANRALDVWHFLLPLTTNTREGYKLLLQHRQDKEKEVPFLTFKPAAPYVGCRLCLAEVWSPPFQNGEGITSTARRHLEAVHTEMYTGIVNKLNLRPQSKTLGVNKWSFSLEHWIELLVDRMVVDD
ncbi:hypothetical protein CPB83DRAFT_899989 [Crepidotus variabilis]|uniref:Uncharacterized protein n=1 Tax=Crepidotus variabilis TaxID=179855 RepID=A0A9P6E404_9AGAR|nr:hypothetical protein CPB83DRAFT_899989 [Crepidotus variabilis]